VSIPLKTDDPAYWMLERGRREETEGKPREWRSTPVVHDPECYICTDKEFELMGLPLCRKCPVCIAAGRGDGHIPADDDICTTCGEGDPPGPDASEIE
jgi:hypothetical protein